MKLNNNASDIEKALKLESGSVKHAQNFVFYGRKGEQAVEIHTTPTDEERTQIEIIEVRGL